MNKKVLIAGAVIVVPILAVLAANLGRDPRVVESPLIGRDAPSFTLRDVRSGSEVSLASLRGRPVVLNFWATWCVPCYAEHAVLQAGARSNPDVQFIGVVFDDKPEKVMQFLKENGSGYPSVLDEKGSTAIAYGVGGVPETFFIGKDAKIVSKFSGPLDADTLRARTAEAQR